MNDMQWFLASAAATFMFCLLLVPTLLGNRPIYESLQEKPV